MQKITVGKTIYRELPCCDVGDYGGSGSVGQANINVLKDQFKDRLWEQGSSAYYFDHETGYTPKPIYSGATWIEANPAEWDGIDLILISGMYSSVTAFLREDCEEYEDLCASLEDYPVLDDEETGLVEMEWADLALDQYALSDIGRALDEPAREKWDVLPTDQQKQIFYSCAEQANVYPVCENQHETMYWDVDTIAPFVQAVMDSMPIVRAVRVDCDTLYELPPEEIDEEPDQYGRVQSDFGGLPCDSVQAYVTAWNKAHHYAGA